MKLYFRHHNQVVANPTLDISKSYSVGRGLNCDIQIPLSTVSRFQGVVYFEQGKWHFRNEAHPDKPVVTFSDSVSVNLKNGLEIFTDTFLANEKTYIGDPSPSVKTNSNGNKYGWQWAAGLALVLLVGGASSYLYFLSNKPFDSKTLMGFSENKILKFELKVKKDVIAKIKKEADLKEDDFKETVGFCTGFLVEKNVLLTAHHCVSSPPGMSIEKDFILKTYDNREIIPKRILGFDFVKDYLFLEVEGFNDNPSFKITENIEIGQKVFTIGNVAGEGLAIREGIISGETEDQNDPSIKYIRFSAAASPGNSGGPLLNERGEVVALVSRKNMAENYNVGISYKDLKNGFNNFVLNRDKKEIIFDAKSSEFTYGGLEYHLAKIFKLPLLERLDSKPHLQEVLNKFIVKFEVPFEFKDSYQLYFEKFHEVAKNKIFEVSQLQRKEHLPGLGWEDQTTKNLPYVIPSTTSDNNMTFKFIDEKNLVPKTLGLIGNSGQMGYDMTLNDWKKEKIYYYTEGFLATKGQLIEERINKADNNDYVIYSSVKDSKEALDVSKYFIASPDFSIHFLNPTDLKTKEEITLKTMKDIFIGPEGAIVSLRYFPFLRPKAKADFNVREFPSGLKKRNSYKDKNQRTWEYYVADFYDSFYIELFCLNNPNTTHCLTTFQEGSLDRSKEDLVKNFVNFELSEKFPLMDFFTPQELQTEEVSQYLSNSAPLKNFSINKNSKKALTVTLKDFNYPINLGPESEVVSLRFIPGLAHNETTQKGEWTSFGVQFIKKSLVKKELKFELCTAGIHFEELKYNAMLFKEQFSTKSTRNIASDLIKDKFSKNSSSNKDSLWKKDLGTDQRNWKKQAYGSCQTLEKNPEKTDEYRADFVSKSFRPE